MGQVAGVVVPGYPHHLTRSGNRRQQTFFCEEDYRAYLDPMSEWCSKHGMDVWDYCLMPNHVHLVACPNAEKKGAGAKEERQGQLSMVYPEL